MGFIGVIIKSVEYLCILIECIPIIVINNNIINYSFSKPKNLFFAATYDEALLLILRSSSSLLLLFKYYSNFYAWAFNLSFWLGSGV